MNILIYGAGAVGLGLASCLLKSGAEVDIIAREDTVTALNKYGLVRTGIFGDYKADPESFCTYVRLDNISEKVYDYIIISIKSFDSLSAAKDIAEHNSIRNSNTKIVLFQNGWGNSEIFAKFFPKEQIYNARVITGFVRPEKNRVKAYFIYV